MSDYTAGDAVNLIETNGLDYAVMHYTSGDSFKDPELGRLWNRADLALTELVDYLRAETGRDDI